VKRNDKNSTSVNSLDLTPAGDDLNLALRSWIENVMVPILVGDYLEERKREFVSQRPADSLDSGAANVRDCVQQCIPSSGRLT
jgi:hypothetical protein